MIRRSNQEALIEKRKDILDKIDIAKDKQTADQNFRNKRIQRTFLENGTVVYRKNEGILTKFEPRWLGPYKIFDHDERGNYSLVDQLGNGMPKKFPHEKLIVSKDQYIADKIDEIKKILKEKNVENKIEYLVEWSKGDQSWVKEEDFQTIDIINDYWKSKASNQVEKRKRGRPPKKPALGLNMVISCLFMFLCLLSVGMCARMKYCSKENSRIIDTNKICTDDIRDRGIKRDFGQVILLNKLHHQVYGAEYRCKASRSLMTCSKSYFWQINGCPMSEWRPIELTSEDCWYMVHNKRCRIETKSMRFDKRQNCDNTGACSVTYIPEEDYRWGTTSQRNAYKCSIQSITIVVDSDNHGIYMNEACKASEYKCVMKNDILVWNKIVIHECPYEIINVGQDFEYKDNIYFISKRENLLFELSNGIHSCGIDMFETNEGIYITNSSNAEILAKKGVKINRDNNFINELLVANMDFNE